MQPVYNPPNAPVRPVVYAKCNKPRTLDMSTKVRVHDDVLSKYTPLNDKWEDSSDDPWMERMTPATQPQGKPCVPCAVADVPPMSSLGPGTLFKRLRSGSSKADPLSKYTPLLTNWLDPDEDPWMEHMLPTEEEIR